MNERQKALAYESATNRRYLNALDAKIERAEASFRRPSIEYAPLSGRVSLEDVGSPLVTEFYVGPTHLDIDGLFVVSWAAPAAATFFKGLKSWEGQKVRVRRRLVEKQKQIINYADEWMTSPVGEAFPARAPSAPIQRPKARPGVQGKSWLAQTRESDSIGRPAQTESVGSETLAEPASSTFVHSPTVPDNNSTPTSLPDVPVFAPESKDPGPTPDTDKAPTIGDLLRDVLSAPRRSSMESVLSTLQPEQYDLVTSDPSRSLMIQGHAGTGKTIVATHRAAWLVNETRESKPFKRVLLFGPTEAWAEYVKGAVEELAGKTATILVSCSKEMYLDLLGIKDSGADSSRWNEPVAPPTGADDLIFDLASRWSGDRKDSDALSHFYAAFTKAETSFEVKSSRALAAWRSQLPKFAVALDDKQWWPMLAYMAVCLSDPRQFDHVMVDEAQDLTSFEWRILESLNGGTWTLSGDMQQRHSQRKFKKWKDISSWLGRSNWDERHMNTGYRTTQAISDFAMSLLPMLARGRTQSPLGQGKNPEVVSVKNRMRSLESLAVEEGERLAMRHLEGLVAVISPLVPSIVREARKSGWSVAGTRSLTSRNGAKLAFLTPEDARGLEFDGVVVVEPAVFRADTGTYGRLYTSLTRANKELVVIHDKPLPAPLQRAARKMHTQSEVT